MERKKLKKKKVKRVKKNRQRSPETRINLHASIDQSLIS
jgi:hypothetical protein